MEFKGLNEEQTKALVPDGLILLGFRGSIAHGTYVPQTDPNSIDDKDIMGAFINPLNHYFGLKQKEDHEAFINEWDAVHYELRKLFRLLLKSNPNVIGLLWLDEKDYIYRHPLGQRIIDNRDLFSSKQIYHSFNGYAWGQFKRMTHFKFEGYMGEKRKGLVEKHGYDTKNAAHLIRLLDMGIEFLNEGVLYVKRKNSQKYLEIKNGFYTLDQVKQEAEKLFEATRQAYLNSTLPARPDEKRVEDLLIETLREFHKV